ncbi:MAG: cytochrome c biogenesis protein CcdA [Cytophagales bacterium]
MKNHILSFFIFNICVLCAQMPFSKTNTKVKWETPTYVFLKSSPTNEVEIHFRGTLQDNYYMYATDFSCPDGPVALELVLEGANFEKTGTIESLNAHTKHDEDFGCDLKIFEKTIHFVQKIKLKTDKAEIAYQINFLTCKKDESCIPGKYQNKIRVEHTLKTATVPKDSNKAVVVTMAQKNDINNQTNPQESSDCKPLSETENSSSKESESLLWYLLVSTAAGLATVFMPCIFPLLPMTISYFSKGNMNKVETFKKAGAYGLSIVVIYTAIAILPSMLLGSERINNLLSTHWIPNALFFLVFVVFGMSFLGAFEITLPSQWTNKADNEADKGGYYGLFFMALTLTLVSFSCTAPFLSSILILSANGGLSYKPLLGMLSYSSGFALPFVLLALAPKLLSNLPKSGTWMNTLKVTFGILELGLSLKFLSTIDLVYGWHILDKSTFLGIWAILALLLSFYLLGIIKMSHDSDQPVKLSVGRFVFATICMCLSLYFIAGIFGKPVTALSGIVPPEHSSKIYNSSICDTPKYSDKLHIPHNLPGYFDLEQAKSCAKAQNKKVLIDFTGHGCANCRKMEDQIWSQPHIQDKLSDEYIIASLYVDDKTELPENQWVKLNDGTVLKTLGEKNLHFETESFCEVSQPLYVVLDPETGKVLKKKAYTSNQNDFFKFLD